MPTRVIIRRVRLRAAWVMLWLRIDDYDAASICICRGGYGICILHRVMLWLRIDDYDAADDIKEIECKCANIES